MDNANPLVIGQRIRQLRQDKKKSQMELGQFLGRTHAAISDIELGKTNLSVQDLTKIASFLQVGINDILQEPKTPSNSHVYYRDARGITPDQKREADKATDDFMKIIRGMEP